MASAKRKEKEKKSKGRRMARNELSEIMAIIWVVRGKFLQSNALSLSRFEGINSIGKWMEEGRVGREGARFSHLASSFYGVRQPQLEAVRCLTRLSKVFVGK